MLHHLAAGRVERGFEDWFVGCAALANARVEELVSGLIARTGLGTR